MEVQYKKSPVEKIVVQGSRWNDKGHLGLSSSWMIVRPRSADANFAWIEVTDSNESHQITIKVEELKEIVRLLTLEAA